MAKAKGHVEFYIKTVAGKQQHRWRLVAANGEKIASPGEFFDSKQNSYENFLLVTVLLKMMPNNLTMDQLQELNKEGRIDLS